MSVPQQSRAKGMPVLKKIGRRAALSLPVLRPLLKSRERHAAEAARLTMELAKAKECHTAEAELLTTELVKVKESRAAETATLTTELTKARESHTSETAGLTSELAKVTATLSTLRREREDFASRSSHEALIEIIKSDRDLDCTDVRDLASAVETFLMRPEADKLGIHREVGKAIFARSADLYSGKGLPASLTRFTYPPFLAILLNTHCNAACFFCREEDYKGTSVEATEVLKLDTAIRHARAVDLTGWGEPFLYPDFEWVVRHVLDINSSPRLIQVTTNGSLLSERWGKVLAGKVHTIVVSLNAATAETYSNQMRYKSNLFTFDRVVSNLRAFLPMLNDEDRERIDLHMVANSDNFREIPRFVELAAELGIPQVSIGHYISAQKQYVHKTLWYVRQEYNNALAEGQERAEKLNVRISGRRFFSEEAQVMGATNCMAPFEAMFIEPSGKSVPCCFMGNDRMGDVFREGFEAVWFSDTMNKLRKSRSLQPCKVCAVFNPFDNENTHISATLLTEGTLELRRDGSAAERAVEEIRVDAG